MTFPSSWIEELHPRRGGVAVALRMSADPAAEAEALLRHLGYDVLYMCEHRGGDGLEEAVHAYRRGEAEPLGAAAVAAAASSCLGANPKHRVESVADGWVCTHGLAFAARACAELGGLAIDYESRHGGHADYYVRTYGPSFNRHWRDVVPALPVIKRVRAHLAACSDGEYDEVRRALAEYRDHLRQRVVAAYLLPSRAAWVDEDRAAGGGGLLVYSLRTVEQLDGYLRSPDRYIPETAGDLATVLEGVGVAGVASVMRWAEESRSFDKAGLETLAGQLRSFANAVRP